MGEEINSETRLLKELNNKLTIYGVKDVPEDVNLELIRGNTLERDNLKIKYTKDTTNLKNLEKSLNELVEAEFCPVCKQPIKEVDHTEEIFKIKK